MRKIKLFTLLAGLMLSVGTMFADPDPVIASGSCGENLTWTVTGVLLEYNYTLTISGTGAMYDFGLNSQDTQIPWRSYRSHINSVVINPGVTHLGDFAFASLMDVKSIVVPDGVVSIGKDCFTSCTQVESFTLPNSLRTIGDEAFYSNGYHLTSITIPEGVTSIGQECFRDCYVLQSISLPSTLQSIGPWAFQKCKVLQSLEIPENVSSIGQGITYECTALASLSVASGNTTYDSRDNCNAIIETAINKLHAGCKNSTIPSSVRIIKLYAFYEIELAEINIPNGVTTIENSAFKLTNSAPLYISASVNNIGENAFTSELSSIVVDENNTTYDSRGNCNAIIETNSNPLKLLKGSLLTVIPEDVQTIGNYAFYRAVNLKSISIPANVSLIEYSAFSGCTGMESIRCYAATPPLFRESTFNEVHSDIPVYVPQSSLNAYQTNTKYWNYFSNFIGMDECVTAGSAGENASWELNRCTGEMTISGSGAIDNNSEELIQFLADKSKVTKITIGKDITSIPDWCFAELPNLEEVEFESPSKVAWIDDNAFNGCTSLTSITLPASMGGDEAFLGNAFDGSGLTDLYFTATTPPEISEAIEGWFMNNDTKIYYPNGAEDAYVNNSGLFHMQDYWWDHLYNASTKAHAPMPHGSGTTGDVNWTFSMVVKQGGDPNKLSDLIGTMTFSGTGAMAGNSSWSEIYDRIINIIKIEDGVTQISDDMFYSHENVTTVHIPASITTIGEHAFYACSPTDIYLHANAADITSWTTDEDDFGYDKSTNCHVLADQLSAYQTKFPDVNLTFVGDLEEEAMAIGDSDDADAIDEFLEEHNGEVVEELTITRPVYCNNYYNTICLPFSMNEYQIEHSSIAGADIKQFVGASVEDETLVLTLNQVYTIEAGKPYFISYSDADALTALTFTDVLIEADEEPAGVTYNGVTFQGTYHGFNMPAQTEDNYSYLFLGQGNKLYWPSTAGTIKPFRAYFHIQLGGNKVRRGMPARFDETNTATRIEEIQTNSIQNGKMIENGQLVIIRNGVKYNAAGQTVK